jgi:hypothetical protein
MVKRSSSIPRIRAKLSDEVAQAFKKALRLRGHREEQLSNEKHCKGAGLCEVCDEYERLVGIVDAALDVNLAICLRSTCSTHLRRRCGRMRRKQPGTAPARST